MLEYQNMKIFLQKVTLKIGLKKFFVIKKKTKNNSVLWAYVINDLNGKEIVGTFYESIPFVLGNFTQILSVILFQDNTSSKVHLSI